MTDDTDDATDDDATDDVVDAVDVSGDADTADAASDADAVRTCGRCGGEAVTVESGAFTLLECADCGNVLGLVDERGPGTGDRAETQVAQARQEGLVTEDGEERRIEEVTATDGELGQLVSLLRAGGDGSPEPTGSGPPIETDRLLIETDRATLEVVADDDRLRIRDSGRDEDREGAGDDEAG